jgi:hypothetical protein
VRITTPLEKLLKRDVKFIWIPKCQEAFDLLKETLVTTPILVLPDWMKLFHVHIDASAIALSTMLAQQGEGNIHHPISFATRK